MKVDSLNSGRNYISTRVAYYLSELMNANKTQGGNVEDTNGCDPFLFQYNIRRTLLNYHEK